MRILVQSIHRNTSLKHILNVLEKIGEHASNITQLNLAIQSDLKIENLQADENFYSCSITLVKKIISLLPHLKFIDFGDALYQDSQAVFKTLANHCPHLVDVSFSDLLGSNRKSADMAILASRCHQLERIDLSVNEGEDNLTDQMVLEVAKNCKQLQTIDLSGCAKITIQAFINLGVYCPHLRCIYLENLNERITNLEPLFFHLPRLRYLNLSNSKSLNDQHFTELTGFYSQVKSIDISYCHHLTDQALDKIADCFPNLEYISLQNRNFTDKGFI